MTPFSAPSRVSKPVFEAHCMLLMSRFESQHFFQPAFGFLVVKMLRDRRYNDNRILVFHLD